MISMTADDGEMKAAFERQAVELDKLREKLKAMTPKEKEEHDKLVAASAHDPETAKLMEDAKKAGVTPAALVAQRKQDATDKAERERIEAEKEAEEELP